MAKRKTELTEGEVVERNIDLQAAFMGYIIEHPSLLDQLPSDFRLVILPENDPELRAYNLKLMDKHPAKDRPVIFVQMRVGKRIDFKRQRPTVYLPLPV